MTDFIATISSIILWLFNSLIAIGSVPHASYVWLDALLVMAGMLMARPAGGAGRRMYARFKTTRTRLVKR